MQRFESVNLSVFHRKRGVGVIVTADLFTGNVVWVAGHLFHRKLGVGANNAFMVFIEDSVPVFHRKLGVGASHTLMSFTGNVVWTVRVPVFHRKPGVRRVIRRFRSVALQPAKSSPKHIGVERTIISDRYQ